MKLSAGSVSRGRVKVNLNAYPITKSVDSTTQRLHVDQKQSKYSVCKLVKSVLDHVLFMKKRSCVPVLATKLARFPIIGGNCLVNSFWLSKQLKCNLIVPSFKR